MNAGKRNLIIILAASLLILSSVVWIPAIDILFFTDHSLRKNFNEIHIGMTKEEVLTLMGLPDKEDISFHLGQYEGFEKEYQAAADSNSESYLFWYGEIDTVYVVGLDGGNRVTIISSGGT